MYTIIYILSISLQLAGALLLMIFALSTKREKIIQQFAGKGLIYRDNNTDKLSYNETVFREAYRNAYLNKCAFAFIGLGYLSGIFGDIGLNNKFLIAFFIIICTAILMGTTYIIVECFTKHCKIVNQKITSDELLAIGIEPDLENISDDKIQELFKDKS